MTLEMKTTTMQTWKYVAGIACAVGCVVTGCRPAPVPSLPPAPRAAPADSGKVARPGLSFSSAKPKETRLEHFSAPKVVLQGFAPILAELQQKTQIPVVLPADVSAMHDGPFYAHITEATATMYEISLDGSPDCAGAGSCTMGDIAAKKAAPDGPLGTENFEADRHTAQKVTLLGDIPGYFVESECGANCDDSKIYWEQNGYEFMVGIKSGSREETLKMANSAITNRR